MEIVEIIPPYLYSVKYDDEQLDEYHRVFRDWHEVGYLAEFFRLNADYLHETRRYYGTGRFIRRRGYEV